MTDKEQLWAELDALGEQKVREKYDLKLYAGRNQTNVEAWLSKQDRQKQPPWHKTLQGLIVLAVLTAFVAGLMVAYVSYRLGWLGTPR